MWNWRKGTCGENSLNSLFYFLKRRISTVTAAAIAPHFVFHLTAQGSMPYTSGRF